MPDDTNIQPPSGNDPPTVTDEHDSPDDFGAGHVIDMQIERELHVNYLTYAMSTIMDRALPDVRDGLKPSQRRILVAMNDLNLRPNRKHIKCAKIAGDTSGNYHPHGESVIYPTLVGMAQPWRMSVPLIHPQGNFGSIDGDPPAAMRYTEARMQHAAVDMLDDIKLDTVDFQPNYDDRLLEPKVLPGKFPNLLINGGVGIAVGMATSLPPHNPGEIFDAIVALIDKPSMELFELLEIVKGPDFPTGGVIRGRAGIVNGYSAGRGKITVRGKVHVEEASANKQQIVIDEIPYQLVQSVLLDKIVGCVKDERIKDISDVRNESGRNARTRIVVELKRGADPSVVENQLYQFTPLQQTYSIMNIALVNRRPRTLTLKQLIELHIDHRIDVIERRTRRLLRDAQKRAHVLEGLIYAVTDIDEVIRLIRASSTRDEAIGALMSRRFRIAEATAEAHHLPARIMDRVRDAGDGVALSRTQAEAIGAMRLIQLVGLEIERLVGEYAEVAGEIEHYESILADRQLVLDMIKADCAEMKARYDRPRLTSIEEGEADIDLEHLIKEEEMAITISHEGYIKRVPLATYSAQGRGGRGIKASDSKDEDFIEHIFVASTHDDLLIFTDSGRVFKVRVYEIPRLSRTSRGRAIINVVGLREGEKAVEFMPIKDFEKGENFLVFATAQGLVKRTPLSLYQNVHKGGLHAIRLNEGDELVGVTWTSGYDHLILGAESGMAIRFRESDARPMGRVAAGVKGIALGKDDRVVGLVKVLMTPPDEDENQTSVEPVADLLTCTANGYGKRTSVDEYLVQSEGPDGPTCRPQGRGGKGRIDIRTTSRNGEVVSVKAVHDDEDIMLITQGGLLVRIPARSISRIGRATQGVRVINLKDGDRLIATARVVEDTEEGDDSGGSGEVGGDPGGE